jgi:NADH:ubiquinone oxidoreductase subunit 4 (subunit M)
LIDGPTWAAGPTLLWGVLLLGVAWPLLSALLERRRGRALVFVLTAQWGIALAGLTTGTRSGVTLAVLHCLVQSAAALVVLGVLHGENTRLGSGRIDWPQGIAGRVGGFLGVAALVCAPLTGGFVSALGIASSALVSEPLGVWGKGQGPFWMLLWAFLLLGGVVIIARSEQPSQSVAVPRSWTAVGLSLAVVLGLGLAPELVLGHVRDAASAVVTRYIGGRIAYQDASPDAASLRSRAGGPLDVGYPNAPKEAP